MAAFLFLTNFISINEVKRLVLGYNKCMYEIYNTPPFTMFFTM
jgi:hypothetical protein